MTDEQPDADAVVIALTEPQRAILEPYRADAARAQANLSQALGLLVVGAGVDLATHRARLSDDGLTYETRPIDPGGAPSPAS